jgi:sensor domain CHASE-containing protein
VSGGAVAVVNRVDLLIAVIGIVVSVVGSSTALWLALSRKPDKEDLARLESRLEANINRVETKLDALIVRLVPEGR